MTGLLPEALRDAIARLGDGGASQSFGLVALVLLLAVFFEREVLRAASATKAQVTVVSAAVMALLLPVVLTIGLRIVDYLP
jgi:hypothetical protein